MRVLEKHGRDVPGGGHRVPPNMSKILRQWIPEEELRAVSTRCVGTPFHHRESVCLSALTGSPFLLDDARDTSAFFHVAPLPSFSQRSHSAGTSRFSRCPSLRDGLDVDRPILRGRERGGRAFCSRRVCVNAPTRGPRPSMHGASVSRFTASGERDCRMQLPGNSPRKSRRAADRVRRCALIDFIHVRRPPSLCVIDRRRTLTRLPCRLLLAFMRVLTAACFGSTNGRARRLPPLEAGRHGRNRR